MGTTLLNLHTVLKLFHLEKNLLKLSFPTVTLIKVITSIYSYIIFIHVYQVSS